jgi:hypothetical protein
MDRALFRALSAQTGAKGVVLTAQQKPEKPTENLELSRMKADPQILFDAATPAGNT